MAKVFITGALGRRPVRASDPAAEKQALLDLAATMSRTPDAILPRLVELAMMLTGATSAGLSLYEPEPAPGMFSWRHVCGLMAPMEDATAPGNDTPCGVVLDRNAPLLVSHPERMYKWLADAGLHIPEELLVPLCIDGAEPLGTLWVVAEWDGYFHQGHADTLTELACFAGAALKMTRAEQRLRHQYDEQELLAEEMSHRLKNVFAMTDGMINISARYSTTVQDMATALTGRLHALAKAHSLVERRISALDADRCTDLGTLIAAVTRAHDDDDGSPDHVRIAGPHIECGAHAANSLALMFHELTTNAAKYGALSEYGGHIDIVWRCEDEEIVLQWRETGGPPVLAPQCPAGFGTTLVARTIRHQFSGQVDYDWAATGLALTIRFAASAFAH